MAEYDYSCSVDGHGLKYPGFSVVFIQTFSIHHKRKFILPETALLSDAQYDGAREEIFAQAAETKIFAELADHLRQPIVRMRRTIEHQIFILHEDKKEELRNVRRFSLRGFDFEMPIKPEDGDDLYPVTFRGHVNVEMNLFFGHTASITYRFLFDGNACTMSEPVATDHIIALLSTYLGAEYWSKEKTTESGPSQTDINLESEFYVSNLWFKDGGTPSSGPRSLNLSGKGRRFDEIALIYKKYIYACCTTFAPGLSHADKRGYVKYRELNPMTTENDTHYAMVDLWENIMHPLTGCAPASALGLKVPEEDLFARDRSPRLSEADIVCHIRDYHRPELIGLLTMYPGEWPYRDEAAYDEVCGENIAIDTDDLVLVSHNVCMVLGTYGRRGGEAAEGEALQGVDWAEHLKERAKYHVSWAEYLLILQMVLAKKHIIGLANDQLIGATLTAGANSPSELIGQNAELSMRLSRMVLQLDVVKYSKFASHAVMFDRTTRRLGLEEDLERLQGMMDMVDNSLHNRSDYLSVKSEFWLNIILAIISCASTFELFFQDDDMPFLHHFGYEHPGGFASWLVMVVFAITFFALLMVLARSARSVWEKFRNLIK